MGATTKRKPEWFFYPGWVALSAAGFSIAVALTFAVLSQIIHAVGDTIQVGGETHITEDYLFGYIMFPLLGTLTGALQYLLLRRYLPRMGWWVVTTLLGWLLLLVVIRLGFAILPPAQRVDPVWSAALAIVLIGGSIAIPQWLMLRKRVRHAALWILVTVAGWGVARLIIGEAISSLPHVFAIGLLPPAVTSLAWWLLLDQLPQREDREGRVDFRSEVG